MILIKNYNHLQYKRQQGQYDTGHILIRVHVDTVQIMNGMILLFYLDGHEPVRRFPYQ